MKILVIDDEDAIREAVAAILAMRGYEVFVAADGRQGIEQAFSKLPDLVLCDIAMPELDGYGVLQRLRDHPATVTLPFIFFSGRGERSDIRQGMKLGADDYLPKPFTPDELVETVESRLQRQKLVNERYQQEIDALRLQISRSLPHELRTPLHGILGSTSFLLSSLEDLEPEVLRQMLECIDLSGKRLFELTQKYSLYINLDRMARSSDQLAQCRKARLEHPTFVLEDVALAQSTRAQRTQDLDLQVVDAIAWIDAENFGYLAQELISNAFKFSEVGTPVQIIAHPLQDQYVLEVRDQGRGMTPEQITHVGAYRQFNRDYYEQQGSGLGLAIVQRIIQLFEGDMTIQSALGQPQSEDGIPQVGTTVRVCFPCTP
jgi:signal transduction histidine kinase